MFCRHYLRLLLNIYVPDFVITLFNHRIYYNFLRLNKANYSLRNCSGIVHTMSTLTEEARIKKNVNEEKLQDYL